MTSSCANRGSWAIRSSECTVCLFWDLFVTTKRCQLLSRLPIDDDDVFMIFEDVYRGRSILPPHDVPNKPMLVRWDYTRPLSVDNVVPMDQPDADKHTRRCHDLKEKPEDVWGQEVKSVYERRTQEILKDKQWFMEMS